MPLRLQGMILRSIVAEIGERDHLLAQSRRRRIYGWALATGAAVERIAIIFVHNQMLNLVGTVCWLLFVLFVTLGQLRSVLKQKEVTGETCGSSKLNPIEIH
jgi:hypothetical protein